MNRFLLYHHKNLRLAQYVRDYSSLLQMQADDECQIEILSLPQQNKHRAFSELPASMRRLLFFAKPDLVICLDDGLRPVRPIFAFEVTAHVPARDHWMQRFPNLVGCAQEKVAGTYIIPFRMPARANFRAPIDSVFFLAYDRVMEIHQTPFYIAEWETTDGRTLNRDQTYGDLPDHRSDGLANALRFLNLVIESAIHGRDPSSLMGERLIVDLRNQVRNWGYVSLPHIQEFARLAFNMPDDRFLTLQEVSKWLRPKGLRLPAQLPDRIVKRTRNLIYVPQSSQAGESAASLRETLRDRIARRGGDPYLGQPLVFDYLFCRLGPTVHERDTNLIIDLSVLSFSDLARYHREIWENSPLRFTEFDQIDHIPQYTMYLTEGCSQVIKNFLRVYAFTADIIVFSDGVIYF